MTTLASRAEHESDFLGDLDSTIQTHTQMRLLAEAAVEMVGRDEAPNVREAAIQALCERGWQIMAAREQARRADLLDGIEAGDLRPDGSYIEYERYP